MQRIVDRIIKLCSMQKPGTRRENEQQHIIDDNDDANEYHLRHDERESLEISFLCALMKVKKMRGNERKSVFASFFFDYFFHYTRWSKKDSDE